MELLYLLLIVYLFVWFLNIQASGYITLKPLREMQNTG